MPAAIVTAIVSSLLLLGIAGTISLVMQSKVDSQGQADLTSIASNVDISLRTDISQATYVTASAQLKQPAGRLLTNTDLVLSGVNMHIPDTSGDCKVIHWSINGNLVSREITIYATTLNNNAVIKCDETSASLAQRTKIFAQNITVNAPFEFQNKVGNELVFTIGDSSLTTVNNQLDSELTAQGVNRLNDTDFGKLNSLLTTSSFVVGFRDPAACVMNAAKVPAKNSDGTPQLDSSGNPVMVCPPPESDNITAAWNSLKISKVSVMFMMQDSAGNAVTKDVQQGTYSPEYSSGSAAEAEAVH